jgi:hypothetical protein
MAHGPVTTFANHRGVVPMLWAFVVLAGLELLAVHLVLAIWWRGFAWFASALTALSIVWLIRWIGSFKRHPHEFDGQRLKLRMGSLRRIEVPLTDIASIRSDVTAAEAKARDTRNLVPIALPNRMIELKTPLPGRRAVRRIAIRVDDAAAFDAAMRGAGVPGR